MVPNYIHDIVGHTLAEAPETAPFSWIPLLTSMLVALGGLYLGWLVYRRVRAGQTDPLEAALGPVYPVLRNKYYFDELYDFLFVRPAWWLAETFTSLWMDRRVIDGILHGVAQAAYSVGGFLRNYIDKPVVNGAGDLIGESIKKFGRNFRFVQTGRVQQYMVMALVIAFGTLFYYLFILAQP
jgi:NADH-quinone oxidoreductase subunit L